MNGVSPTTLAILGCLALAHPAAPARADEPDRTASTLSKPRPPQPKPESASAAQQPTAERQPRGQNTQGGQRGDRGQPRPTPPPPAASPAPPGRATYVQPPRDTTPDRTRSGLVVRPGRDDRRPDSDRRDRDCSDRDRYDRDRYDRDRYDRNDRARWDRDRFDHDGWHDRSWRYDTRVQGPLYVFPSADALDSPLLYSTPGPSPLSYSYPQEGIGNYSNPFEYNRGSGGVILQDQVIYEHSRPSLSWLETTPTVIVSPPVSRTPAVLILPGPSASAPPPAADSAGVEGWRADQRLLSQINTRYDVSNDFGIAVRAAIEGEYSASIAAMRRAAAVNPDAIVRPGSTVRRTLRDDDTKAQQTRYALAVFRSPPGRVVSDADAAFMTAALAGALGETTSARSSVLSALSAGDGQNSTVLLNHALSQADQPPPSPWQAGTPLR